MKHGKPTYEMKNLIKSLMRTYTRSKFEPVVKKYQTCLIRQISFKFQFDQILFKFFAPHVQISFKYLIKYLIKYLTNI